MSHNTSSDPAAGLPDQERQAIVGDLERLRGWAVQHQALRASVSLDRSRFEAGRGVVLIVMTLHDAPSKYRQELKTLVAHPDRLRVQAYRPAAGELVRVLRWVLDQHMGTVAPSQTVVTTARIDEEAQLVIVTLNRHDEDYADELSVASDGLIRVEPNPTIVEAVPPAKVKRHESRTNGPTGSRSEH